MDTRVTLLTVAPDRPPTASDMLFVGSAPFPWAQVREQLGQAVGWPDSAALYCDNVLLDADAMVGEPPLVAGAVIMPSPHAAGLEPHDAGSPSASPALRLATTGGFGAGTTQGLRRGAQELGRASGCAVRCEDPGISRLQLRLTVEPGGLSVEDLGSNAALVDGRKLGVGHRLVDTERVRVAATTFALAAAPATRTPVTAANGYLEVHLGPRIVVPRPPSEVGFPEPLRLRDSAPRLQLLAAVLPLVAAVVLATVLRSPSFLLFALLSPVIVLGQWVSDRRHHRRSTRAQQREHHEALALATRTLASTARHDTEAWHVEQPDLSQVMATVAERTRRLWERRPTDPDWAVVRVGSGTLRTRVPVAPAPTADLPELWVADAPLELNLAEQQVIGITGEVGLRARLGGALMAQLLTWHSHRRLIVSVIANSVAAQGNWTWLTRVPHARQAGSVEATLAMLLEELTARSERRQAPGQPVVETPWVVVVEASIDDLNSPTLSRLLEQGPACGIWLVCIAGTREELPDECRAVLDVDRAGRLTIASSAEHAASPRSSWADLPHPAWLDAFGRALAPLRDASPDAAESALATHVALSACLGEAPDTVDLDSVESLAAQWSRAATRTGLPAAVGVDSDGVRVIDLVADGPHALIAGTTGAGKSQFLRAWVAAMAALTGPDRLSFILVDYKGGSAFAEVAGLPHTVGLVTDLDEHLTARALTSLQAEIKRRERLLREVAAPDFAAYDALRAARPALPRLVIVIDEFKVLADELPAFVEGLVRLAAVGRSLGLHLVLATQRPAGSITAEMRANIGLRVALRVRDRTDSLDVIDDPRAAETSPTTPGRAWVRSSAANLFQLQTADTTVVSAGQHATAPVVYLTAWDGTPVARAIATAPESRDDASTDSELSRLVGTASQAARRLGLATPTSPWLAPLPDSIALADLNPTAPGAADPVASRLHLGLLDDPEHQSQRPWTWDVAGDGHLGIAGASRTGRTTALRGIVVQACRALPATRVHVHVLTTRPEEWGDLAQLGQVGTICGTDDAARLATTVRRLTSEPRTAAARLLVIDGYEAVERCLEPWSMSDPACDLATVLRDGLGRNLHVVAAGDRSILMGQAGMRLQHRIALAVNDPTELVVAGVPLDRVPGTRVPGRAIDLGSLSEIQLADTPVELTPGDLDALGVLPPPTGQRESNSGPDRPWRLVGLPHTCPAPRPGAAAPRWAIGVGGDEARVVTLLPGTDLPRFLVAGPPGSGRSTTLAQLLRESVATGRRAVVVARRESVLTAAADELQVTRFTPTDPSHADAYVALRREHPDLVVLVDDAESTCATPIAEALHQSAELSPAASGVVVAAVDTMRAHTLGRGLVSALAADASGIVLWPEKHTGGEVLGVRLEAASVRVPGRGHLVLNGRSTPVQVALPEPPLALTGCSSTRHLGDAPGYGDGS